MDVEKVNFQLKSHLFDPEKPNHIESMDTEKVSFFTTHISKNYGPGRDLDINLNILNKRKSYDTMVELKMATIF
jgi:hypothetical protein